jgi:hypothetical protein
MDDSGRRARDLDAAGQGRLPKAHASTFDENRRRNDYPYG